jgi:hypothetical protein
MMGMFPKSISKYFIKLKVILNLIKTMSGVKVTGMNVIKIIFNP